MAQEEKKNNEVVSRTGEDNGEGVEPDVILDIPKLKVDEINLDVEDLEARVSLSAKLADMVNIEVGAYVHIDKVNLDIKGVEAEAHLKVRLERVKNILTRTLETLDNNPEILKSLLKPVGEGSGKATGEIGEGAGELLNNIGKGVSKTMSNVGDKVGSVVKSAGEALGKGEVSRTIKKAGNTLMDWSSDNNPQDGDEEQQSKGGKEKKSERSQKMQGQNGSEEGKKSKLGKEMEIKTVAETQKGKIERDNKEGEQEKNISGNGNEKGHGKDEEGESYPLLRKAVRGVLFMEEMIKKPFE